MENILVGFEWEDPWDSSYNIEMIDEAWTVPDWENYKRAVQRNFEECPYDWPRTFVYDNGDTEYTMRDPEAYFRHFYTQSITQEQADALNTVRGLMHGHSIPLIDDDELDYGEED